MTTRVREQLLVKSIEYEKAQAQKYFELYTQVCETAQLRLKEIARLQSRLAEQPAEQAQVALGPLAKRRVFDYIRGAYDLGYNDARNARAIPGDNAPGYKGRDVEADHGGALFNALCACITAPQRAKRVPLTDDDIDVLWAKQQTKPFKTHAEDRMAFARALIAAYDAKNGITGDAE